MGRICLPDKITKRVINEPEGGGKTSKAIALEVIKEWLEPEGYKVTREEEDSVTWEYVIDFVRNDTLAYERALNSYKKFGKLF